MYGLQKTGFVERQNAENSKRRNNNGKTEQQKISGKASPARRERGLARRKITGG